MRNRHVLMVLPERVHLMDVAGPVQVFMAANDFGTDYTVGYVADVGTVTSFQGLPLRAETSWPELRDKDLVIVPGWRATHPCRTVPISEPLLGHVRSHAEHGGAVASVCAGALALARIGMLDGHAATTHHELIGSLRQWPRIRVLDDVLFTCEPRLHTSAGIASGIDLALHLVAHDHGAAISARVARSLVVPAWRPGSASQQSIFLTHRDHMDDVVHRAQDYLDDPTNPALRLDALGTRLGVSGRTLARHFVAATGMTPQAYASAVRQERAEELMARGWTREAAARAVGYEDARSLRKR